MYTSQSPGYTLPVPVRQRVAAPVYTTETVAHASTPHWALVGTGGKHRTKKYPPRIKTDTIRVYELARMMGLSSKDTVDTLRRGGEYVTSAHATIPTAVAIDILGLPLPTGGTK